MATFVKLPSGSWRAVVRHKNKYVSRTFQRKDDARGWARDQERSIDQGRAPVTARAQRAQTFGDLIDLHIADMKEVGKPPGRSKDATLAMLKRELGDLKAGELDRDQLIRFGRRRAGEGAGPVTLSMDIGAIRLVVSHGAAVHGLPVAVEPIDLARIALKRLGLIGKSNERDRRPTDDELEKLIAHFDGNERQIIPMGRIIKFAIASAMRQEEICRVVWDDLNTRTKMLTIRDRKDPRQKKGNDQRIPLLAVSDVAPNEARDISSWAYDYAASRVEILDNRALGVACYHPGHTLVEKLQAISTKFRQQQATGVFPSNFMRHYYDVYSLLQDPTVQAFIGTEAYRDHKARRFPKSDNPVIAENEAFMLGDPATRATLQKAYAASSALYFRGQPAFDDILAEIAKWAPKL